MNRWTVWPVLWCFTKQSVTHTVTALHIGFGHSFSSRIFEIQIETLGITGIIRALRALAADPGESWKIEPPNPEDPAVKGNPILSNLREGFLGKRHLKHETYVCRTQEFSRMIYTFLARRCGLFLAIFSTLEFQIHLLLFLSSRLSSCRIPSCSMGGIHAICLSTKKKVVTGSLRRCNPRPYRSSSRFGLVVFWSSNLSDPDIMHSVACT